MTGLNHTVIAISYEVFHDRIGSQYMYVLSYLPLSSEMRLDLEDICLVRGKKEGAIINEQHALPSLLALLSKLQIFLSKN